MNIHDTADTVRVILELQQATATRGIKLSFEERQRPYAGNMLAAIMELDGEEHCFFTWVEAKAFLRGLDVSRKLRGKE